MKPDDIPKDILDARNRASYQVAKAIGKITDCIYDTMRRQGLTQAELARRLGKSRTWVSKLLSGDHNMTMKTAVTVFHELGYGLDLVITPATGHVIEEPENAVAETRQAGDPRRARTRQHSRRAHISVLGHGGRRR